MDIPLSWLRQYAQIDCDTKEFVDKMTLSGTKVEGVSCIGYELKNIVVGRIEKIEKHPQADKLLICKVDVGTGENLQILTGATNLYEGAIVPVALDGSVLAGGREIRKGKMRGEESNGMLCSIDELGYTAADFPEAADDGIYIFPEDIISPDKVPLGEAVQPIMELVDDIVEFEITSNRPDCYSVIGIAREAAATFDKPFKFPEINVREAADGKAEDMLAVEIRNPELCPRYIARAVKNVKIGPSPQWLRRRITKAGMRPINNIVDITNYVMLELGQPMHAFDIDNIAERRIIVRNAVKGEKFTTLDGVERELDESMTVIADCEKAVAIGGVMGGENSKVTEHATAVLFESANFKASNIRQTSKKLGMRTDASGKYEKGIDPNLCMVAVNRAVQLVEMLGCGEVVPGCVDCYPNVRGEWTVNYSADRINAFLGTDISAADMEKYLARVEVKASNGVAKIPTFRPDIQHETDIAEEVARLYGYDRIEATLVTGTTPTVGKLNRKQFLEGLTRDTMVAMGLCESLHYAFESPRVLDKLRLSADHPMRSTVKILNPLGEDFSIMRTSTLNGILTSLSTNYNRRNDEAWLFEVSKIYLPKEQFRAELPDEPNILTVGFYGKGDFYNIKGICEELFRVLDIHAQFKAETEISYMHPGRCAAIMSGDAPLGYLGEIHPAVAESYDIGTKAYVAVINLDTAFALANTDRQYKPLPKFPAMQRDISMTVSDEVSAAGMEAIIRERGGKILESVELFDVYKGKQIQEGHKSVAYKLLFRADDRTLTDDEVSKAMKKILNGLQDILNAVLRV